MIRISNIKIRKDISHEEIVDITLKKYKIKKELVKSWHISKKSIDARKKEDIHYTYAIDIDINNEEKYTKLQNISKVNTINLSKINVKSNYAYKPIIIGSGPAGIFAGLNFVQNGIKPIIIEQGQSVDERKKTVDNFINTGKINIYSNVQFGEGGAGTFSDGKLTTGINSPLCQKVLKEFVNFGAPEQILYLTKPHIGTDNLINIIKNMRNYIISKGGQFLFNTKFIDFETINNRVSKVFLMDLNNNNSIKELETNNLIFAIGHSSRDTFEKIYNKGILMEAKNFSVGVRIEHLQSDINTSQYGKKHQLKLPAADYKLAYHSKSGRSCYTFCMCPGGIVMPSSSEKNTIVTNGMSYFARDGKNANSAILVNVVPSDFKEKSPLSGIYFQKELEEKAFILGGSNYYAPIQRVEDFLKDTTTTQIGKIEPTYKPGYTLSNLNKIMPKYISETLKEGIKYFDTKLKGFANPDSILTGLETRSSSPVRILRNENLSTNIQGIYPCGEGAGYAGGIMSAAVDGLKCSTSIMKS